jgi:hypothetical protein
MFLLSFFIYFLATHPKNTAEEPKNIPIAKESDLSPSPTPATTPPEEESPSQTPEIEEIAIGEISAISSKEASDPWTSKENKIIRYLCKTEGNIYQIDTKTKTEDLSTSFTPNLIKILWSPNGYHLINVFKEEGSGIINKYSYNLITTENIKLGGNLKYVTWSPDGEKIAYHYYDPKTENGFISIADPDGKNWQNLTPVSSTDFKVEWPLKDKISFTALTPPNTVTSDFNIINPETGESPKPILQNKYGLGTLWSPSGTKLLFSSAAASGGVPRLYVLNEALEQKALNVESLAEKCVWSKTEKIIYCAVPNNNLSGINLPQDWYSTNFIGQDIFIQVNIETGEKKRISEEENYDATNLSLSPEEDYLYFINKESRFLYELRL